MNRQSQAVVAILLLFLGTSVAKAGQVPLEQCITLGLPAVNASMYPMR
jgi:hypothetical protein